MVRITKVLFILIGFLLFILTTNLVSAGNRQIYGRNLKSDTNSNETIAAHAKLLKRNKRYYLLWSGITKCVLGVLMPVETRDNVNWRTLNMAHNFQAQYQVLPRIAFPWDKFARSLEKQRKKYDENGTFTQDGTRAFVYNALERWMDYKGKSGNQCLLKAICEATNNPIKQRTIFDQVVHIVLTPNKGEVDEIYLDARNAGSFGADCTDLYPKCRSGDGLLDSVTYYF